MRFPSRFLLALTASVSLIGSGFAQTKPTAGSTGAFAINQAFGEIANSVAAQAAARLNLGLGSLSVLSTLNGLDASLTNVTAVNPNGATNLSTYLTGLCQTNGSNDCSGAVVTATGGTAPITAANRGAFALTVNDFGAKLTGTVNESGIFNTARSALPFNGVIRVPPGGFNVPTAPTGGPSGPVEWLLSGNTYGTTTNTVNCTSNSLGNDWVKNFAGNKGGDFTCRNVATADTGATVRHDMTLGYNGGTTGFVVPNFYTFTTISSTSTNLNNYIWNDLSVLWSYSSGPAQNVGKYIQSQRLGGNSPIWAAVSEVIDKTSGYWPSATVGHEFDVRADGPDPLLNRIGADVVITNSLFGTNTGFAEASHGFRVQPGSPAQKPYSVVKKAFEVAMQADVALDTTNGSARSAVSYLPVTGASTTTQVISLNGTTLTLTTAPTTPALAVGSWVWISGAGPNVAQMPSATVTTTAGSAFIGMASVPSSIQIGDTLSIPGAGANGAALVGTVQSITTGANPGVTLSANAGTALSAVAGPITDTSAGNLAAKVTAISGTTVTLDTAATNAISNVSTTVSYTIGTPPLAVIRANPGQTIDLSGNGSYVLDWSGSAWRFCRAYGGVCAVPLITFQDGGASFNQPVTMNSDISVKGYTYTQRYLSTVKTAAYTLTANDNFVAVNASSGAVPITLPACTGNLTGQEFNVKKTDSSANAVTVGNSTDTVDGASGASAVSLTAQYGKARLRCTTTNTWYLL